jgi:hypothetical protein
MHRILAFMAIILAGCGQQNGTSEQDRTTAALQAGPAAPQDAFWYNLQSLCGEHQAAQGRLVQAPPGDTQIDPESPLVVHFMECGEDELRFPLHVGENRSRTWVFIRHDDALELRHDHRHEDGTEESNTWYGASTVGEGDPQQQEFLFERDGMMVGWRVAIEPGQRFTYGTIRDGAWRHHMEFDLTQPAPVPPLPWGHETRPSQRP